MTSFITTRCSPFFIFSVPICAGLSLPLYYIWMNALTPVTDALQDQYRFGCLVMTVACVLELCAEAPAFVGQVFCFVKLKIVMDTTHIFVRSLVFILLVVGNSERVIWAFGIAQLASCLTILCGNYGYFYVFLRKRRAAAVKAKKKDQAQDMEDFPIHSMRDFLPFIGLKRLEANEGNFNPELQKLVLSFLKQGMLKQILTEGEKYVMSISPVLTFSQQATYDVVNNMGSLAARFIFRPIEDSSYFYFTQTLARDVPLHHQKRDKVEEASGVLSNICKGVLSVGLVGFVFGQSYSGTLLLLYGGQDFVAGGLPELLLRWHCLSIVLLAVNGISEGYMFATNTSTQIDKYNYLMAAFSVTFLVLSYQLTSWFGPVGFILANCTNMALRIGYSLRYIRAQYKGVVAVHTENDSKLQPLSGLRPDLLFVLALVMSGVVCSVSQSYLLPRSIVLHIGVGMFCLMIVLCSWMWENRAVTRHLMTKVTGKFKTN